MGKQIYNYRPITPNICTYFSLKKWKNHPKEHKKCINNKKKRNRPQKVCNYTAFISTNHIFLRNLQSKNQKPYFFILSNTKMKNKNLPSPLVSLIPIAILVVMLAVTIHLFGSDALGGGSQVCLLSATGICVLIGMLGYKRKWKHFEKAIINNINGVATALIILLIIGALSGAWMISGLVPTLIYYGIQIIHPSFFLVSTCLICCIVSVMTGSSWTTIATIGIALMGIGEAQGFEPGWIAGAIISGAYFGDKLSPLSDTTNLAPAMAGTDVFTHVKYMVTNNRMYN